MSAPIPDAPDPWLVIGHILGPQGLKGEVRVYPDSDFPERFEVPGERWLSYPDSEHRHSMQLLRGRRVAKKGLYVIQLEGVNDRTAAEALRGCSLWVHESERPHLGEGEFYLSDLVGLDVVLQDTQQVIGRVISLIPAGNDLLEVQLLDPKCQPVLIPFVEAIVPHIHVERGYLEITPPRGLLP